MQYYPLLMNMTGARCLVVGAGEVGCRKLADLLTSELAEAVVLDIAAPSAVLTGLLHDARVRFEQRPFEESDVRGKTLVFAATGDHAMNSRVLAACETAGVLCNCADDPERSGFIVPSRICEGRVTVSLSTQGASPALARRMREEMTPRVRNVYAPLAELLARLRPGVLALGWETRRNTELFRHIVHSDLGEALAAGDTRRCTALLQELLPDVLRDRITELLYGLV